MKREAINFQKERVNKASRVISSIEDLVHNIEHIEGKNVTIRIEDYSSDLFISLNGGENADLADSVKQAYIHSAKEKLKELEHELSNI